MIKLLILIFAIICVGFGWSFRYRDAMPMDRTAGGELIYPISSGSNDIAVLSLGLLTFILTAGYALISIVLNQNAKFLVGVYLVNIVIFTLFVLLVSMDSSFLVSAQLGDNEPLISLVVAFIPLPVMLMLHIRNKYQ